MRSPNPRGGHFALLNGVSCPAPTKCVAVGSYGTGARARTLVERWNGTKWWIERSPNPRGRHFSELAGVACPVVDSCIAVGDVDFGRTLIQRWDGTAWRFARSPTLPGDNYLVGLFSVACPSATDCVAVGLALDSLFGDPNAGNQALIERWNGATWSTVPNPKLPLPALLGVACVSATSCYAVGSDFDRGAIQEHWNGVSWSLQT
jgi:hypothetical protein